MIHQIPTVSVFPSVANGHWVRDLGALHLHDVASNDRPCGSPSPDRSLGLLLQDHSIPEYSGDAQGGGFLVLSLERKPEEEQERGENMEKAHQCRV